MGETNLVFDIIYAKNFCRRVFMKGYIRVVLYLIFCFMLTGCNNGINITPTASAINDLPTEKLNAPDEELENAKSDKFKKKKL